MSMDLTGITNKNEYYTNHYFATVFEENAGETITAWNAASRESEEVRTPWSMLRRHAAQFYAAHDRYVRSSLSLQTLYSIKDLADTYLDSLGYPAAVPLNVPVDDALSVPVYLEMKKQNGAPLLWVVLMASAEMDAGIMESFAFDAAGLDETSYGTAYKEILGAMAGEDLATKILFGQQEPPRFLILIGMNQIALIDRNKWNEKRYLQFELEEIFSRLENTTLQAMSVLLHRESLCPEDGKILLDELDEQSQRNASGVSQDLKYALRESIELLGNEVLYDMRTRQGRDLEADPVDAGQLTIECLRYMYRMLFVLFIESRPELGYAPIKAQSYYTGYSLESLRDIADNIRDDINEVGNGYYLHETLAKLYDLIYNGYPKTEEELSKATGADSLHDMFLVAPLKAHIFDPEYTKMITAAKLRNSCMLRIIELMSLTKSTGRKNSRRGRISYANLGINQMGAVYEALLSYRGFIAEHDLYEVKKAGDKFNELDVGYFVPESELDQYTEDERVRYESGEKKGKLRMYEKGTFIYRLAGREREKSASYYTPEVLTKCLVKYALKELLEGKTADQILDLTICEPAMGSAAFLNEAINQLAEAYISRKEQETGNIISYENRFNELQKVKMYIADRNVYGIDLNPVAVELAEVSLWLNTIYEGGFVPWFGTQLVNGNSLIGARRQVYAESSLCELLDDFVEDTVLANATATRALSAALANSRWAVGSCDDLGKAGCWLYHTNALAALRKVCDVWGGEALGVVTVDGGRVAARTLSIVEQVGSWRGARFTYGKNLAKCTRTVLEDEVYTALYGFGAGLPNVDEAGAWTGGYRRKLTFGEVNGGVNWVGDEQARLTWGRWNAERTAKVHSYGQITFSEIDDPAQLLAATRAALPLYTQPRVSYELDVALIEGGADARLGDTVAVIDTSRDPEWRLKARVVKRVRTFSDEVQVRVTLGTVQPASYSATSALMERMAAVEDTAGAASDNVVAIGDAVTVDSQGTVEPIATQQYVDDAIANLDDLSLLDF